MDCKRGFRVEVGSGNFLDAPKESEVIFFQLMLGE